MDAIFFKRRRQWNLPEIILVVGCLSGALIYGLARNFPFSGADAFRGILVIAICLSAFWFFYRAVMRDRNLLGIELVGDALVAVYSDGNKIHFNNASLKRIIAGRYRGHGPSMIFDNGHDRLTVNPHEYVQEESLAAHLSQFTLTRGFHVPLSNEPR